jgi:magnesium chelatase accessory protein
MPEAKPHALQGFEERYAELRGVRLRYEVGGSGPPLVLVHGLGGAASNWAGLAPALARRFRVLVPDLPGHGGSGALPAAASMNAFADRIELLAAREAMLPAAVVGHSAGGLVALRLAARSPETVTAVVLAASAGISTARRAAQLTVEALGLVRPGRIFAGCRGAIVRYPALRYLAFGWWGVSDPPALSAVAVEAFLGAAALHTDTVSLGRALVRDDVRLDLERVSCPCLVLWGARDNWVLLEDGYELARRLRAPLRLIPDCGHLLIGERPDACQDAIGSFLSDVWSL